MQEFAEQYGILIAALILVGIPWGIFVMLAAGGYYDD